MIGIMEKVIRELYIDKTRTVKTLKKVLDDLS